MRAALWLSSLGAPVKRRAFGENTVNDAHQTFADFSVPKADNGDASTAEIVRARCITRGRAVVAMTIAIELDAKLQASAIEIKNIRPDRMLAPESITAELRVFKFRPQEFFNRRRVSSQLLSL